MNIAAFVLTALGFVFMFGSTFVGVGLYVGKQISKLNAAINNGSAEVKVLTNNISNLKDEIGTMGDSINDVHTKINGHSVTIAEHGVRIKTIEDFD